MSPPSNKENEGRKTISNPVQIVNQPLSLLFIVLHCISAPKALAELNDLSYDQNIKIILKVKSFSTNLVNKLYDFHSTFGAPDSAINPINTINAINTTNPTNPGKADQRDKPNQRDKLN